MLLGRPTEDIGAPRTDDEQASSGSGDDISFRSERRPSTVIRMVGYDLDDDGLSIDLDALHEEVGSPAVAREIAFVPSEPDAFDERLLSSASARGPPSVQA